jgi:hypothetical protein
MFGLTGIKGASLVKMRVFMRWALQLETCFLKQEDYEIYIFDSADDVLWLCEF